MFSLKKLTAIVFIFVLLIPSTIQAIHAFENHEHTVCNSLNEHHIHELDVDCSELHLPFETYSTEISSNYDVIPQHFYSQDFNKQPQKIDVVYLSKKSSRAPPIFVFLS